MPPTRPTPLRRIFPRLAFVFALAVLATAPACAQGGPGQAAKGGDGDWTRFGFDAQRSNAASGGGLTADDLSSLERQQVDVGGTVDASPIYLRGVTIGGATHDAFFVTTTYGKTVAIDADDGTVLWTYTPPGYDGWAGSYRITTATPVADPDRQHLYAAAPDGKVRKLAVADGSEVWSTAVTRLPEREKIAASLNLADGRVLVSTGGYIGDKPPYQGHVALLDASDGSLVGAWNALCSDRAGLLEPSSCPESGAALWGRGGVVVDPEDGSLFVASGDGRYDGATYWGDAVLQLAPDAGRLLGNYTPEDTDRLDRQDVDLGSSSPALLGGGLVVQGGKDEQLHLLDWSAMQGDAAHRGGERQSVPTPSGAKLFTSLAVWQHDGTTWLFAADAGATAAWTLKDGKLAQAWHDGHGGTSPVLVDGLLYVFDPGAGVRVYRADGGDQVALLEAGRGHWNSPIVADGRVALPEGNANDHETKGVLDIWRKPR